MKVMARLAEMLGFRQNPAASALGDIQYHDELHDGEFEGSDEWTLMGAWNAHDLMAGATAVALTHQAHMHGAKELLILIRNSNPDMPQLWWR